MMIIFIAFISITCGLILGPFINDVNKINNIINSIIPIILMIMIISVGIDLSYNNLLFDNLKKCGLKFFVVPLGIVIGSILSGILIGRLIGLDLNVSTSISAGMGYYSITTVLLREMSGEHKIGLLAFITNLFREILAFILIPIVAKKIGYLETVAVAGVNSLDTNLPVISLKTNHQTVIISIINGAILSILVPILIPLLYNKILN